MSTVVSNPSGDGPEKIERAAKILRSSKQAKAIFRFIYTGNRKGRTMKEMRGGILGFNENTFRQAGRLAAEDIIEKRGSGKKLAYLKVSFYNHNKSRILRLSENKNRLKNYPTKRKNSNAVVSKFYFRTKPQAIQLTIDDVDSFKKSWKLKKADTTGLRNLPERKINRAICTIVNQSEKKDWGGERNDIYTNNLVLKNRRVAGAFALKGKATKGTLTLNKMGKKADQIPRLFEGTAEIHFVVHHSDIDERVLDQMQAQAINKSVLTEKKIYYCPIDGKDLARLRAAYPRAFI